jgi:GTPase
MIIHHSGLLKEAISSGRQLPPEKETGNVEYKLLLHPHQPDRLEHYISQLKWRLAESQHCVYMIGVEDSGEVSGTRRVIFDDTIMVLTALVCRVYHIVPTR